MLDLDLETKFEGSKQSVSHRVGKSGKYNNSEQVLCGVTFLSY